jgi:aspartyl-tRNA synthetase
MVFIDLRDHQGLTQLKFNPETDPEAHRLARLLRNEYVVAATGHVGPRPTEMINPKIVTGEVEVNIHELSLLSKSDPPPFEIDDETQANEEVRLRYRFLDLRRPKLQQAMRTRAKITKLIRDYFHDDGFVEVETPFLTKSTPEGARDYLVPSRVQPGTFYALPQSPQLFKQLMMIGGLDRYVQIVRCFRDEDLRADRQPEFTQLDMEMAFVTVDDVLSVVEGCLASVWKAVLGVDVPLPMPRLTYKEAMDDYGIDRPDTRFDMKIKDATDLATKMDFNIFRSAIEAGGVVRCLVAKGGESLTRRITDGLTEEIKGIGGGGMPMTKIVAGENGLEAATGIARFCQPIIEPLCAQVGAEAGDAIFFSCGSYAECCKYLSYVRGRLADIMGLIPENTWNFLWVVDFPLVEYDEDERRYTSVHHPFTSPYIEDVELIETDPGAVRAQAYDVILNGLELGGGSIRIHDLDLQRKVFGLLGIDEKEAHEKFEFLMDALRFGAPPHGGIALGMDRIAMLAIGAESLRDVIAFPKTQRAICPLTRAPSEVGDGQLNELALRTAPPKA